MRYEDRMPEVMEVIAEFDAGYDTIGTIEVMVAKCDVCHTPMVPVLTVDSSGGEYGAGAICKDCIDKAFKAYNKEVGK
jgi:hypothetical protein